MAKKSGLHTLDVEHMSEIDYQPDLVQHDFWTISTLFDGVFAKCIYVSYQCTYMVVTCVIILQWKMWTYAYTPPCIASCSTVALLYVGAINYPLDQLRMWRGTTKHNASSGRRFHYISGYDSNLKKRLYKQCEKWPIVFFSNLVCLIMTFNKNCETLRNQSLLLDGESV